MDFLFPVSQRKTAGFVGGFGYVSCVGMQGAQSMERVSSQLN
jgi:hypothetical protein